MFDLAWHDAVGTGGVTLILIAYFLLLSERLSARTVAYSLLNLIGALMITVSLLYDFNFSAFVIEIFWIAVSIYGLVRAFGSRRHKA